MKMQNKDASESSVSLQFARLLDCQWNAQFGNIKLVSWLGSASRACQRQSKAQDPHFGIRASDGHGSKQFAWELKVLFWRGFQLNQLAPQHSDYMQLPGYRRMERLVATKIFNYRF